ncbi:phosphatidate cytidylyltransferase [Clostridium cylindrosporum]|uniref:Phosphatidate cytidylyltransferase n=1 Tax=Clostridium cylindrosporum DSM 605 TaxID=1121307 RepID=A0A0J8DFY2_CLOCY|nr:phosphatidate cytidylyltransferase [Clostridium cylindrosporum]KMT23078.1 phosphatidate cytidylyltransferase [Clostridium cylindrosporum DSM 605]
MNIRLISALIAFPILVFFVVSGGYVFKVGIGIITAIAIYEYTKAYKPAKINVIWPIMALGFFISYLLIFLNKPGYSDVIIYFITLISMATPIFNQKYNVLSSAVTVIGYIYIVNFFELLIPIRAHQYGSSLIWLVLLISFFCDTFAYYIGKTFGKHKLCPIVSPKKTVEGSIGGIIGSVIGVVLWGVLNPGINFTWTTLIILGIVSSVISQVGDLSASIIKRYSGVKDYGKIMPGHGGILDRFDSILFTAPVVYYYIIFFIG